MRYLLTFKPLKHFFFGNDKTFKEDYFAISEYFPQNTQLLGALRLFIAEQNGLMHMHRNGKYSNEPEKLKELIGDASASTFEANTNLGKITNLSQMFIVNKKLEDAYFPTPFDVEISKESIRYYTLTNIGNDYFFKDYDVKNASSQRLAGECFWSKYLQNKSLDKIHTLPFEYNEEKNEGVFIKHTQVGIGLDKKRVIEKQFYAKTDYRLSQEYLFCAVIELEDEIIKDGIIQIGAESSLFELKVRTIESTKLQTHPVIQQLFSKPKQGTKIVSLSESMVENTNDIPSIYSVIPFSKNFAMINDEVKNQFIKKTSKEKNYTIFKKPINKKRLIPSGSVFYFKEDVVLNQPAEGAYTKMGYNQFLSIQN